MLMNHKRPAACCSTCNELITCSVCIDARRDSVFKCHEHRHSDDHEAKDLNANDGIMPAVPFCLINASNVLWYLGNL